MAASKPRPTASRAVALAIAWTFASAAGAGAEPHDVAGGPGPTMRPPREAMGPPAPSVALPYAARAAGRSGRTLAYLRPAQWPTPPAPLDPRVSLMAAMKRDLAERALAASRPEHLVPMTEFPAPSRTAATAARGQPAPGVAPDTASSGSEVRTLTPPTAGHPSPVQASRPDLVTTGTVLTPSDAEPTFACLADPVQDGCPSSTAVRVGGFSCDGFFHPVALEFLSTPVRLRIGLVGRRNIAHSAAVFMLGGGRALPLVTQDVFFPVDIVAIDADGRITIVAEGATPGRQATALPPARGIAIMAGGELRRLGVAKGCTFALDAEGPDPGGFTPRNQVKPGLPPMNAAASR